MTTTTEFDCGRCDPGCGCLKPEELAECGCGVMVVPNFLGIASCGVLNCRSYAEAEHRADMNGARI